MPNISDFLFETERELVGMGLPKIPSESLRAIAKHLQDPQFQQLLTTGQITSKIMAQNVLQAVQSSRRQGPISNGQGPAAGNMPQTAGASPLLRPASAQPQGLL